MCVCVCVCASEMVCEGRGGGRTLSVMDTSSMDSCSEKYAKVT